MTSKDFWDQQPVLLCCVILENTWWVCSRDEVPRTLFKSQNWPTRCLSNLNVKHKSFLEIFSVVIGVINKIAGVRFFNHGYDYSPNWTIRIEFLLEFYHNHYNFRETKCILFLWKSLVVREIYLLANYQISHLVPAFLQNARPTMWKTANR